MANGNHAAAIDLDFEIPSAAPTVARPSATDNVRVLSPRRRDLKLARAIAAGEDGAFDRLHAEYRSRLYAFALKRLRDPVEAEDVVQDVFIQAFRCIGSYEGRSSLLTWLFGVTHHQICRRLRKRRLDSQSLDAPEAFEVAGDDVPTDRQVDAARLLAECNDVLEDKVTDAQREIFRLRYAENFSTVEIAEQLGKSKQAVKISLFRARRTIAAELAGRGLEVAL